eukprot:11303502-Karenia_brevis.AAC.1
MDLKRTTSHVFGMVWVSTWGSGMRFWAHLRGVWGPSWGSGGHIGIKSEKVSQNHPVIHLASASS